jgi:hypothetical protein
MSDLVVIAFPTEAKAEEVRQKLLAMQKEYLIELGDAVIARPRILLGVTCVGMRSRYWLSRRTNLSCVPISSMGQ